LSFFTIDIVIDPTKTSNGSFDVVWIALKWHLVK